MRKNKIKQLNPFIILFIFIIFLTVVILLIFQAKKISVNSFSNIKSTNTNFFTNNVNINNPLGNQYTHTLNSADICKFTIDYLGSYITEPICSFSNNSIIINGKINYALGSSGTLIVSPVDNNDELHVTINEGTIGIINIPKFILNKIKDAINLALDQNFNKYAVTKSYRFTEDKLIIIFERRK